MNFARRSLSSMKKSELKRLASLLTDSFCTQDKGFSVLSVVLSMFRPYR